MVSGTTTISPVGTQANGAIPYINSIAFNQAYAAGVVKGGSNGGNTGGITGWAVGNDGLVYTTSWNSTPRRPRTPSRRRLCGLSPAWERRSTTWCS